jgi:hypothetical protein
MQKENNTKQAARPRRSRMPQIVYDIGGKVCRCLTHWKVTAIRKEERLPDEQLCDEIAQPLRNLSSLIFHKELDAEMNIHPHNRPYECEHIIIESMRLAYGIQDLIDASKRVSKVDRALCANLFEYFKEIEKAAIEASERAYAAYQASKSASDQQSKHTPKGCTDHGAGFDWSLFGVHHGDTLLVNKNGQAAPGQLILVRSDDGSQEYFARCCFVKDSVVRCANDEDFLEGDSYDKDISTVVGAVVEVRHESCAPAKIKELRGKLNEIQNREDSYVYSEQIAGLEKEIFGLENPLPMVEDDSRDEWPDVIGAEVEL